MRNLTRIYVLIVIPIKWRFSIKYLNMVEKSLSQLAFSRKTARLAVLTQKT